jgi:hypothetical protein
MRKSMTKTAQNLEETHCKVERLHPIEKLLSIIGRESEAWGTGSGVL